MKPDPTRTPGVRAFRLEPPAPGPPVLHAFSTRRGGLAPAAGGTPGWAAFLRAGCFPPSFPLREVQQVHGAGVHVLTGLISPATLPLADAVVSSLPSVVLGLRTADCAAVLLADPRARVVGAAHAGWRGLLSGVIDNTVGAMMTLGAAPGGLRVGIGPSIGSCCFRVGPEVADRFAALDRDLVRQQGRGLHVDLPAAVERCLRRCGVPLSAVRRCPLCTCCRRDLFFSHRGDQGCAGRLLAAVALCP
ncbi:MAG: peptidoglycan editing factor PgeF [Acidobacteriota bacterium]